MLVSASRQISALALRVLFYGGLFCVVVLAQITVSSALRSSGWNPALALTVSGLIVLGVVLLGVQIGELVGERRASDREMERLRQGLPAGPCCVVWPETDPGGEDVMPWEPARPIHAPYPALARRLRVEGVAVVGFEVNAEGRAKAIHCIDVWPSEVFYAAAKAGLENAQFKVKPGADVRFGKSYTMPFVFRIAGAAKRRNRREANLPPQVLAWNKARAARAIVDNWRGAA